MSITLKQAPPLFSPVYNEMVFVADSTNKTQANFKYIFSIFDKSLNLLARVKRFPEPVNGYGFCDVHRFLENYVTYDLTASQTGFYTNGNSYKEYTIYIGEEYGSTEDLITYESASTYYAYNAVFDYPDFVKYNQADWLMNTGIHTFLTNAPVQQDIRLGTNAFLHFMANPANKVEYALIQVYAPGNDPVSYPVFNDFYNSIPEDDTTHFLRIPCGPANLDGAPYNGGTITLGEGVSYYTIQLFDDNNNAVSKLMTYNIDYACSKYDISRLHFLNKLGGFDSLDFKLVSTEEVAIQRSNYMKIQGGLSGSSYTYSAQQRGKVQYSTVGNRNMMLTSDWFDDASARWLEELATSPEVYMETDATTFIPVNLTDETYQIGKKQNTKLINLQLNLTFSYNKIRQRG